MMSFLSSATGGFSMGATMTLLLGGLGIFLLGMKQMSEGLQAVVGPRIRKIIGLATNNRFAGVTTGTIVTTVIQSSSVTTVMVVGMVTSGVMTLVQAIHVILGANIGTTITAWVVAIFPKMGDSFGLGLTGVAALIYLFAKRESWKYTGLVLLGLGLVFVGLNFITESVEPLKEMTKAAAAGASQSDGSTFTKVLESFNVLSRDGTHFSITGMLMCIFVGATFTAIIQSSSATTAIAVLLVTGGMLNFETAATLVLGMNIGTTITTWLAAIGAPTNARRTALAHTLFNIIGVILMAPLFPIVLPIVNQSFGIAQMDPTSLGFAVAGVHTAFNVINTLLFLPFTHYYATLITRIIPDAKVKESPRLTVLNPLKTAPVVAVEQARREVERMSVRCDALFGSLRKIIEGQGNDEIENDIFHAEDELDILQHEVSQFLGVIMSTNLPSDVAYRARMLLRVADEYESVSDEAAALLKQLIRMRRQNLTLSERGRQDLLSLHDLCKNFSVNVSEAFRQGKYAADTLLTHIHSDAAGISSRVKEIRKAQMMRMSEGDPTLNPLCSVIMLDLLNVYRRLKEDYLNIGEAMLEESHAQP
ncbi:MAG: Na/Pi symporter [bacterium]|nr:Na/Pi symporter [bacterium]